MHGKNAEPEPEGEFARRLYRSQKANRPKRKPRTFVERLMARGERKFAKVTWAVGSGNPVPRNAEHEDLD